MRVPLAPARVSSSPPHHRGHRFAGLVVAAIALLAAPAHGALPAFPGADGWGKNATGGGQDPSTRVIFVTSPADSGPGTLREALKTPGPRIVLFKTGGVIELKTKLSIQEGSLTIAGQTAPGDGIIVRGHPIRIAASNVVIRGLRIRPGDGPGAKPDQRDAIQFGREGAAEPIHDIIVDHCSFGWAMDETAEFWFGCRNVTMSYCVLSEALWKSKHPKGAHGYAMLLGNGPNQCITLHHNLFAHNERRSPWVKDNATVEIINNVIYNWGSEATGLWLGEPKPPKPGAPPAKPANPCLVNLVGNIYKGGEAIAKQKHLKRPIGLGKIPAPGSRFYLHDNLGHGRTTDEQDDWEAAEVGKFDTAPYRAGEPVAQAASGLAPQKAPLALARVLQHAGALPRDKADARAVEDTRSGGGRHIDNLEQIGGYPAYAPGTPPPDTDQDGIPDDWERAHGLNPDDKSDATRRAPGGYLHLEEYINSLIPRADAPADQG